MLTYLIIAIFRCYNLNEMKALHITAFCILAYGTLNGQVGFFDGTAQVLGEEEVYSTICIGFDDLNGDLKDDLFLLDEGKVLKTFIQGPPRESFSYKEHLQVSAFGDWAIISGDLDNDASPEIICSGIEDGSQFLGFDGDTYNTIYKKGDSNYAQNSNLVDLNNDGFLDFFVCNDDGENFMFLNDGSGGMIETKLIDFQTTPDDDMSGNYTSIFADIDGDDDLDLYIGKCRAGVTDPEDPRRINTLYINNGDGTYTENAEAFGLNTGAQSWSVDAGDVDNDGDTDIIIANHDRAHDLMINDGNGHFDRKTIIPDGYHSFAYQSFFGDFDNNGWLDIFITDPSTTFILFNDEMSFTRRDLIGSGRQAFSGATGDLNSDGFLDLYLSIANSFQNPSSIADKVYLNDGNSNNYLDINLVGTSSNRDAIGAKVILYEGDYIQSREVLAGKSYGIMNTTQIHFGLGKTSKIDSIKVKWPSGIETTIDDILKVNTLMNITENGCVTSILMMSDLQLCGGDSIEVSLPIGYDNYKWSDESNEANIWITEPGWYRAELEKNGCITRTSYFEVTEEINLSPDDILPNIDQVVCEGDLVKLKSYPGTSYSWSTGDITQVIDVVDSGIYSLAMTTNCDTYISNQVEVLFADINLPIVESDSIILGGNATFISEGEELYWYQNKNDVEPLAIGNEFITPALFESQTYYVGEPNSGYGFAKNIMPIVPLNSVGDTIYTENEFVQFEILNDLTLNSVKVRTQKVGFRRVLILEGNIILTGITVDLTVGVNTIDIDYSFSPGVYTIGTFDAVNQTNLGTDHPQLSYSTVYSNADKRIEGYLKVEDSEIYPGTTPYFFDWDIDYGFYYCEPRVPVHAIVKDPVSTDDLNVNSIIYPNPTSGQISIRTDMEVPFNIDVFDVSGRNVINTIRGDKAFMTVEMPIVSGLYLLKLTNGRFSKVEKVYVY